MEGDIQCNVLLICSRALVPPSRLSLSLLQPIFRPYSPPCLPPTHAIDSRSVKNLGERMDQTGGWLFAFFIWHVKIGKISSPNLPWLALDIQISWKMKKMKRKPCWNKIEGVKESIGTSRC